MQLVNFLTIPVRTFIGLWVGIVFSGGYAVRAQEVPNIDTVTLFTGHTDMLRIEFDDTMHVSASDEDAFRYAYRWNINGREIGEDNALDLFQGAGGENAFVFFQDARSGENVLDFSFMGQRKNKITGSRVAPIGHSYYFDITPSVSTEHYYFTQESTDTIYLEAFPDYANTPDASWLWVVDGDTLSATGSQIQLTAIKEDWLKYETRVDCYVQAGIEGKVQHAVASIHWYHYPVYLGRSIYLSENKNGHFYHLYIFNQIFDRIYAHPNDTLCLDAWNPDEFTNDTSSTRPTFWTESCTLTEEELKDRTSPFQNVFFRGTRDRDLLYVMRGTFPFQARLFFIHWGLPEIETDSVWVFFPKYPYSNLGGRVDICLPHDAPLPSAEDTVQVFNLGPWNRELEYVEYAWLDGTKDVAGADSVVGTDSAFAYLFGRMDSVNLELYAGTLVTRVASDSLWQDSCSCYIPCTEAACSKYDTVRIYLHLLPSLKYNVFLPHDTTLCAHQDLELFLPKAEAYRCFWLDRDSVALPYGYDTARYTVQGMRGLDGYGTGTDTREPRFFQLRLDHKLCGVSFFDTLLVYDQVRPAFELLCHDTLICLDEPVEMDSLSPHVYRPSYIFEWNDGTKGSDYVFTDSGVYVLQFFVDKDYAVCGYDTASDTIRVRWSDPAQTRITLSDTSFCEKLSVTLDASVPCPTTLYCWQDGPIPDPEEDFGDETDSLVFTSVSVKVFKEEGTYNISLLDTMGCINRKEIAVTIEDCSPKLDIPNVFTPNGDGVNDVWRFKQLEYCVDVKVEVVDRWGQSVLKTKVATADDFEWNGTVNNKGRRLPDGPYFYMVSYKDVYGKSKVQSGSITILGTSE